MIFKTFPDHKTILFCAISFMFTNLQIFVFRYYHQDTEYKERQEAAFPVFIARFIEKNTGISFTIGLVALTS